MLSQQLAGVDAWWNDVLALLSEGDGARVSVLLRLPIGEFYESLRVWRNHVKLQAKAAKRK